MMPWKDKQKRYDAIKDWNRRHPEKRAAYTRKHNELRRGREYWSRRNRAKKYGLSDEDYKAMLISQESKCAACDREVSLVVDHDHQTGKVRGLLCIRCNTALGVVENQELFEKLQQYLEASR